jgi:hypothetical protein
MFEWFKKKEPKLIEKLKPGESRTISCGMAGMITKNGAECDICGLNFEYEIVIPYLGIVSPFFTHVEYGKYKPSRAWFCRTHTNKEIENKLKELDV